MSERLRVFVNGKGYDAVVGGTALDAVIVAREKPEEDS